MKKIIGLVFLIISVGVFGQNPPGYQGRIVRERIQGSFMVDSTQHVPRYNGVPSGVRGGGSIQDGAIASDTLNGHFYHYWNTVWKRLAYYTDIAAGQVNIYNTDGILTGNRTLTGLNNTYALNLDSLNSFRVSRDGITRIHMNSSVSSLYSADGNTVINISNGLTQLSVSSASNYFWGRADSFLVHKRISYEGNIHSTFYPYSLVDKSYVDSVAGTGSSGTVNSGASLKAAYYPSAGTTVDDVTGVEYNNTNLLAKFSTQATTDVGLGIKLASSQTANALNISSSSGTGDLVAVDKDGKILLGGSSAVSGFDLSLAQGLYINDVAHNDVAFHVNSPSTGATLYLQNLFGAYRFTVSNDFQLFSTAGSITFFGGGGNSTTLNSSGLSVGVRLREAQGADVASSAGAIAVGTDGNSFEITGTNAVTLLSNTNWVNGSKVTLFFTSTASLVHGTANSGTDIGFELAGATNFTGSAGAAITVELSEIGGTQRWREIGRNTAIKPSLNKGVFIQAPTSSDIVDVWQTPVAITVTSLKAILRGSSPSVTYNIRFGTDITSATTVFTSDITCTSITTGCSNSSGFNDATIPAGSFIWVYTTAASGTINSIALTINYTED